MAPTKRNKIKIKNQKVPRSKEKYPALNSKRAVKNRQEQLEVDYLDQLNDKEKAWLNAFLEETVITNFSHKGKKFYKNKKDKREFWRNNNARNRCIYTQAKATGKLSSTHGLNSSVLEKEQVSNIEDVMIEFISLKRSGIGPKED